MECETQTNRGIGLMWMCFALLVYAGSLGPVIKLVQAGTISKRIGSVAGTIYAPIEWLTDVCEPADDVLTWYLSDVWKCDLD